MRLSLLGTRTERPGSFGLARATPMRSQTVPPLLLHGHSLAPRGRHTRAVSSLRTSSLDRTPAAAVRPKKNRPCSHSGQSHYAALGHVARPAEAAPLISCRG